jgi:hypothetical protein
MGDVVAWLKGRPKQVLLDLLHVRLRLQMMIVQRLRVAAIRLAVLCPRNLSRRAPPAVPALCLAPPVQIHSRSMEMFRTALFCNGMPDVQAPSASSSIVVVICACWLRYKSLSLYPEGSIRELG